MAAQYLVELKTPKRHLDYRQFRDNEQELVCTIEEAVCEGKDYVDELEHQLDKVRKIASSSIWEKDVTGTRHLAYSFKKTTLEKPRCCRFLSKL